MMKQPFDKLRTPQLSDVLDECLTLLAETSTSSVESDQATIEEYLARYPQHAADLRPLLEVALEISRVPQPSSSPAAFSAGKRCMLRALAEKKRYQPSLLSRFGAWVAVLFGERRMAPARRRALTLRLTLAGATALVLLAGGLLFRSWLGTTVTQTATLEAMSGVVEVRPAGSETWLPASPAQQLKFGDRIRTGPLSAAMLTFFDGSKTVVEAETEIAIAEMRSQRDGTAKVIVLYQRQGRTYHRVQPLRGPACRFEVETPTAVTAVRGTEFAIAVKADGTTEVKVREGGVKVIARGKTVEVLAGQATSVEPDLPPAAPFMAPTPLLPLLMETPTPIPTSEPTETPAPSVTPTPTESQVPPTPTQAPAPPTPTEAPPSEPTATPIPTETPTPTPEPSVTPTPTELPTSVPPELTATPTPTPLPTSVLPEPTVMPTPTELPSPPAPEQAEIPQSQEPTETPTATKAVNRNQVFSEKTWFLSLCNLNIWPSSRCGPALLAGRPYLSSTIFVIPYEAQARYSLVGRGSPYLQMRAEKRRTRASEDTQYPNFGI